MINYHYINLTDKDVYRTVRINVRASWSKIDNNYGVEITHTQNLIKNVFVGWTFTN